MADQKCPDCSGELVKVKVFGRGWENPISKLAIDAEFGFYTEDNSERNDFLGMFKANGTVDSYLCSDCGRIFFYGTRLK
jgi:DNA-directed RNA polymerase subunit RPC12/RpoP